MSSGTGGQGEALEERLRRGVRDIPDYPKPGVVFKDITPLLGDAALFAEACDAMAETFRARKVTHVAAVESRGFIFGGAVARSLAAGVVPVRKKGKLPWHSQREEYELEYGSDALEVHLDAVAPGARVLVVDDVLATGGTAAATCRLLEKLGAEVVGCCFLIRLSYLQGLERLDGRVVRSLIVY